MRVHILGSAAGGGVPQWNCKCPNCRAARRDFAASVSERTDGPLAHARGYVERRTQSSVAVSADEKRWVLLNASPDLPTQFARFPALTPGSKPLRGAAVEAVVLTDGELDHVTGLLSLREQKKLRLVCTRAVRELLTKHFPLLPTLAGYCRIAQKLLPVGRVNVGAAAGRLRLGDIWLGALDLSAKAPPYSRRRARAGDAVGLRIESPNRSLVYMPCLPAITPAVRAFVAGSDCLLLDGTFWSNDEMTSLRLTHRTARDMGHVPIGGPDGSLAWLRSLSVPRRIYIHINNTNPILRKGSRERNEVESAGVEVGYDGMDIRV